MPQEFAIGSAVYSYTLSIEINRNGSFHIPKHCQHDLHYWLLCPELFLYQTVSMFPLRGLSFLVKPICKDLFLLKHASPHKLHIVYTFQLLKISWLTCLSWEHSNWFTTILNSFKRNNFVRIKWFLLWTNSKQYRVYIHGKTIF